MKNPLKNINSSGLEDVINIEVVSDKNIKPTNDTVNADGVGIDLNFLISNETTSFFGKWKKKFLEMLYNTLFFKKSKNQTISSPSEKNIEDQKKYLRELYLEVRHMNKSERLEGIKERVKDEALTDTLISLFEKIDKKLENVSSELNSSSQTLINSLDSSLSEMDETSKGLIKQVIMMTPGGRLFSLLEDEFGVGSRLWESFKKINEKSQEYFKKTEEELIEIELDKETREETFVDKLYNLFEKYFSAEKEENNKTIKNDNTQNNILNKFFSPIRKFFLNQQDEQTKLIVEKEKQQIQEEETQDKLEEIKDAITELELSSPPEKEKEDENFLDKLFSGLVGIFTGGKIGKFFKSLFGFKFIKSLAELIGGSKIAKGAGSFIGKVGKFGKALGIAGLGFSVLAGGYTGAQRASEWFNKNEENLNWKEKLSSIIGGIIESLTFGLFDGKFIAKLTDGILNIASSLVEGVWNIVKTVFETGWNYITDSVTGYFKTLKRFIWDPIVDSIKGIANFISDIFSPIKDFFNLVLEGLNKFLKVINPLYGIFENVIDFFGNKKGDESNLEQRAQELQKKGYWIDDWGKNSADVEKIKKDFKAGKLSNEDVQAIVEHGNLEAKYEKDLTDFLAEQDKTSSRANEKYDGFYIDTVLRNEKNRESSGENLEPEPIKNNNDFYIDTVLRNEKKKRENEDFFRQKSDSEEQTLAMIKKVDEEKMLRTKKQNEDQRKQRENPVVVQSPPVVIPPDKKKRVEDSDLVILTSTLF